MKFCSRCGTQFSGSENFCRSCGAPISNGNNNMGQPQQFQSYQQNPGAPIEQKSKLAAGLFGIFLGAFGVHNFYLGFTGKAVAQLLISVLSCFALSFVSVIWGLIEGILILSNSIKYDAKGNLLGE